jgi:hypothetical protein
MPKHRFWTRSEKKLLGTMPDKDLAERINRTLEAIRWRRLRMKLPPSNPKWKPWTEEHLTLLGKLSDKEVAACTGHPIASVQATRYRLGIDNVKFKDKFGAQTPTKPLR